MDQTSEARALGDVYMSAEPGDGEAIRTLICKRGTAAVWLLLLCVPLPLLLSSMTRHNTPSGHDLTPAQARNENTHFFYLF